MPPTVTATPAAEELLERLRAEHGRLTIFQSGGCCEGSTPICLPEGELPTGPNDLLLGEVGGTPVYVDAEQYARWRRPALQLDVGRGPAQGFSLSLPQAHLVTRTPSAGVDADAQVAASPHVGASPHVAAGPHRAAGG